MRIYSGFGKRILDILFSLCAIIILSLLFGCIILFLIIRQGKPVFFVQVRPGHRSRGFKIIKFRTMANFHNDSLDIPSDAERLTKIGYLLRKTSLDELPELWNVLRGDMSLVGPRPLLVEYLDRYTPRQARRHEARPGITGWAQVNGRNVIDWEEKFEYDEWYVDHLSFWLDLRIIGLTLLKVLAGEGISHDGHVTMPGFRGSRFIGPSPK